jgi:hypothetical protein
MTIFFALRLSIGKWGFHLGSVHASRGRRDRLLGSRVSRARPGPPLGYCRRSELNLEKELTQEIC